MNRPIGQVRREAEQKFVQNYGAFPAGFKWRWFAVCGRKKAHPTIQAALPYIQRNGGAVYKCAYCPDYHVGTP